MIGDAFGDTQSAIQIDQVDAATQQDVLAIVDRLRLTVGRHMWIGSSPSPEKRTSFKDLDGKTLTGEGRSGRQAS
jgi:hypothetical protein